MGEERERERDWKLRKPWRRIEGFREVALNSERNPRNCFALFRGLEVTQKTRGETD